MSEYKRKILSGNITIKELRELMKKEHVLLTKLNDILNDITEYTESSEGL